jgi:hypothetical protein
MGAESCRVTGWVMAASDVVTMGSRICNVDLADTLKAVTLCERLQ